MAAGLAAETPAERENAVPELLALLVVHEFVTETLLELHQALCFGGWMRACARLMLVHSGLPFCGPGPGVSLAPAGPFPFLRLQLYRNCLYFV
jgi:hypothetical protein